MKKVNKSIDFHKCYAFTKIAKTTCYGLLTRYDSMKDGSFICHFLPSNFSNAFFSSAKTNKIFCSFWHCSIVKLENDPFRCTASYAYIEIDLAHRSLPWKTVLSLIFQQNIFHNCELSSCRHLCSCMTVVANNNSSTSLLLEFGIIYH